VGFPLGAGVDECSGLENAFIDAFRLANNFVQLALSALINGLTTGVAAFVTGFLVTKAFEGPWNLAYWLALIGYSLAMTTTIGLIREVAPAGTAKTVLLGMGGALIGFVLGLSSIDFISRWWTSASLAFSTGATLQMAAAKATVNYLASSTVGYLARVFGFASWDNIEFNVATGVLGILALGLGASEE
jgi:hypothetical protein